MEKNDYKKITDEDMMGILGAIKNIEGELAELKTKPLQRIYSNKEMQETLGVSDKLLMLYRNERLLPHSRCDDKYWYTQDDLDYFMNKCGHAAYARKYD